MPSGVHVKREIMRVVGPLSAGMGMGGGIQEMLLTKEKATLIFKGKKQRNDVEKRFQQMIAADKPMFLLGKKMRLTRGITNMEKATVDALDWFLGAANRMGFDKKQRRLLASQRELHILVKTEDRSGDKISIQVLKVMEIRGIEVRFLLQEAFAKKIMEMYQEEDKDPEDFFESKVQKYCDNSCNPDEGDIYLTPVVIIMET